MPKTLIKTCGRCGASTRIPKPNWKEMFQKTPHYRNARRQGRLHLWCHCDLVPFVPSKDSSNATAEKVKALGNQSIDSLPIPESVKEEIRNDLRDILRTR
jgi:hypothetical protein